MRYLRWKLFLVCLDASLHLGKNRCHICAQSCFSEYTFCPHVPFLSNVGGGNFDDCSNSIWFWRLFRNVILAVPFRSDGGNVHAVLVTVYSSRALWFCNTPFADWSVTHYGANRCSELSMQFSSLRTSGEGWQSQNSFGNPYFSNLGCNEHISFVHHVQRFFSCLCHSYHWFSTGRSRDSLPLFLTQVLAFKQTPSFIFAHPSTKVIAHPCVSLSPPVFLKFV